MKIVEVKYIKDYILECHFEDGKVVTANFSDFLHNAKNPMTTQFLDKERFAKVQLFYGDLTWEDGQMDISCRSIRKEDF